MSSDPSGFALPPYRHRPGRTPHPERDPAGHRFLERLGPDLLPAPAVPLSELPEAPLFRYGERLFRDGYWWEAHAVWEELWRSAAPGTPEREALRGFIQLAAAALKQELGSARGSHKLLGSARSALERAGGEKDAPALAARFEELRAAAGVASRDFRNASPCVPT